MDYQVVSALSLEDLSLKVRALMAAGWQLSGGASAVRVSSPLQGNYANPYHTEYLQAMTKSDQKNQSLSAATQSAMEQVLKA